MIQTLYAQGGQILVCLIALTVGYRLPDLDLTPVLPIRHRSAWTHGPLFAFGAVWCANAFPQYALAMVFMLAAITLHLLEDVSPRRWQGSALINCFPLPFSLPAPMSWAYLAASTLITAWAVVAVIGR